MVEWFLLCLTFVLSLFCKVGCRRFKSIFLVFFGTVRLKFADHLDNGWMFFRGGYLFEPLSTVINLSILRLLSTRFHESGISLKGDIGWIKVANYPDILFG